MKQMDKLTQDVRSNSHLSAYQVHQRMHFSVMESLPVLSQPLARAISLNPPCLLPKWPRKFPHSVRPLTQTVFRSNSWQIRATVVSMEASERQRLKSQLYQTLEKSDGLWSEDCLQVISQLQKLNPCTDLREAPELYKGYFDGNMVSIKNTGRKGEAQKVAKLSGSVVTLGRATFNGFKPHDLEICIQESYNHVGEHAEDEYVLILGFSVVEDLEGLQGLLINKGKYQIVSPTRMDIMFNSSVLAPRYPEKDLARWRQKFGDHNPGMDLKGCVALDLPGAKGWIDYLYLDDELRITKGNQGSVSGLQRLKEPAIFV